MSDYCKAGEITEIPKLDGKWQRMPDDVRYRYDIARTQCPLCLEPAAGTPWGGWFSCDFKGCCVALVDTGEVFVRVRSAGR